MAALAALSAPSLPLQGTIGALARDNVKIDKLTVPVTTGTLTLNGVTVVGSSLSKEDLEALLKTGFASGNVAQMQKFDAEKLSIASAVVKINNPSMVSEATYTGIEASAVTGGVANQVSVDSYTQTGTLKGKGSKAKKTTSKIGRMVLEKPDVPALIEWIAASDPSGKAPMKPLYGRYTFENMEFGSGADVLHVDKLTGDGIKARLLKMPLLEYVAALNEADAAEASLADAPAKGAADEAAEAAAKAKAPDPRVIAAIADMYASFQMGDGVMEGFRFKGVDPKTGKPMAMTSGPMTFKGGDAAEFVMNDFEIKQDDGYLRIKKTRLAGDPYGLVLGGLMSTMPPSPGTQEDDAPAGMAAAGMDAGPATPPVMRDIIFRMEGLDADMPPDAARKKGGTDKSSGERVKFSVGAFEISARQFVGMVPTQLAYVFDHIKIPIDEKIGGPQAKSLQSAGIKEADVSFRIVSGWDEATSRLQLSDLSLDMEKVAHIGLKADVGNIPRTLFTDPANAGPEVLMTGTLETVSLNVADRGGINDMLAAYATSTGVSVDEFKTKLTAMVPDLLTVYLADHPDTAVVAAAVNNFIQKPGTLDVAIKSAGPSGLSFLELMAGASDPVGLLRKFRFEATAR